VNVTESLKINHEKMSIYNRNQYAGYLDTMGASMGTMTIGNEIVETEQPDDFEPKLYKSFRKGLNGGTIIRMKDKSSKTPQGSNFNFRKIKARQPG
jgi:hypothetical protein